MPTITLAENLKSLRKQHSYMQKDISAYLNVTRQCYSQYESGHRNPDYLSLIRLARLYQVSLDYLFFHSDNTLPMPLQSFEPQSNSQLTLYEQESLYLTTSEIILIQTFRQTSPSVQKKVLKFLEYNSSPASP